MQGAGFWHCQSPVCTFCLCIWDHADFCHKSPGNLSTSVPVDLCSRYHPVAVGSGHWSPRQRCIALADPRAPALPAIRDHEAGYSIVSGMVLSSNSPAAFRPFSSDGFSHHFDSAFLTAKEPDLGTAILQTVAGGSVLLLAGSAGPWSVYCQHNLVAVPFVWHFMHDYQKQRILTFLNPERDPLGAGYHIIQSKIAIGSGGLFGKGFLHGTQSIYIFCLSTRQISFLPCAVRSWICWLSDPDHSLYVGCGTWDSVAANGQDTFSRLLAGSLTLTFLSRFLLTWGWWRVYCPLSDYPCADKLRRIFHGDNDGRIWHFNVHPDTSKIIDSINMQRTHPKGQRMRFFFCLILFSALMFFNSCSSWNNKTDCWYQKRSFIHSDFFPAAAVQQFIHEMVQQYHFSQKKLVTLFDTVKPKPAVIRSVKTPLEKQPWYIYRLLFVTRWRTHEGAEFWQKNAAALEKAEKIYGVLPP